MYVWARMARMLATAQSRGPYVMGGESRLAFRCLPTDIFMTSHQGLGSLAKRID